MIMQKQDVLIWLNAVGVGLVGGRASAVSSWVVGSVASRIGVSLPSSTFPSPNGSDSVRGVGKVFDRPACRSNVVGDCRPDVSLPKPVALLRGDGNRGGSSFEGRPHSLDLLSGQVVMTSFGLRRTRAVAAKPIANAHLGHAEVTG
jgi:hypothetical protein